MTNTRDYVYYAWLSHRLGSACTAQKRLIELFGDAKSVYECRDYSLLNLTDKQKEALSNKSLAVEERAINSALNTGFSIIHYNDERYPKKLKQLSNPPCILYAKGIFPDFDKYFSVGIVGTRRASAESLRTTQKIASALSEKGVIIISGLAFGIDAEAHSATLKNGGFTVGISAVKAGRIYPKENEFLYSEMYKRGLVISEHSPVAQVEKSAFPMRNRIISALSDALIMMEAPDKSGALITAEKSLSLKKSVFVPYGDAVANSGGRKLLEKNAIPLSSEDDILNSFSSVQNKCFMELNRKETNKGFKSIPFENKPYLFAEESKNESTVVSNSYAENKTVVSNSYTENKTVFSRNYEESKSDVLQSFVEKRSDVPDGLDEIEKKIYVYLKKNFSASTDKISKDLGLSSVVTTSSASMLEIYGYIKRMPGDKWSIL